jgi:hypothetical protein
MTASGSSGDGCQAGAPVDPALASASTELAEERHKVAGRGALVSRSVRGLPRCGRGARTPYRPHGRFGGSGLCGEARGAPSRTPCFSTGPRFAEGQWGAHQRGRRRGRFGGLGSTQLDGVAGWRFTLRDRTSVRRGVVCEVAFRGRPRNRFGGLGWPRRCRSRRRPAAATGANVLWAEPRGLSRLEELETAFLAKRTRARKGLLVSHRAAELARPSGAKSVVSESSGSHLLRSFAGRARNPMGACRVKQTGEVSGGENRQEGAKP